VEAGPGGHVEVQVGVVDAVQAPQGRDRMDHDVLQIDDQIEGDDPDNQCQPAW